MIKHYLLDRTMLQAYSLGAIALLSSMSPGPDFVVLSKYALLESRKHAFFCALGIALGIMVHVSYCVLGLSLIISQSIFLFNLIKLGGAAYLVYLGVAGIRSSKKDPIEGKEQKITCATPKKAFSEGFCINVLNPKCCLFMLSVFTVLIDPHTNSCIKIAYGFEISLIALTWFSLLACGISLKPVKERFSDLQHWISRLTGLVLISLGLKIAFYK